MTSKSKKAPTDARSSLLILKYDNFSSEVSKLFSDLNSQPAQQRLFFSNPSLVLRSSLPSLAGANVDDQFDQVANRILFSVLSNDKFLQFLKKFQEKKSRAVTRLLRAGNDAEAAKELDESAIRMEFATAMLKFGDRELLFNILGGSAYLGRGGSAFILISTLVLLLNIVVVVGIHVLVHTVVKLLPIGPPSASPNFAIPASELRKIADELVAAARRARASGELTR